MWKKTSPIFFFIIIILILKYKVFGKYVFPDLKVKKLNVKAYTNLSCVRIGVYPCTVSSLLVTTLLVNSLLVATEKTIKT